MCKHLVCPPLGKHHLASKAVDTDRPMLDATQTRTVLALSWLTMYAVGMNLFQGKFFERLLLANSFRCDSTSMDPGEIGFAASFEDQAEDIGGRSKWGEEGGGQLDRQTDGGRQETKLRQIG